MSATKHVVEGVTDVGYMPSVYFFIFSVSNILMVILEYVVLDLRNSVASLSNSIGTLFERVLEISTSNKSLYELVDRLTGTVQTIVDRVTVTVDTLHELKSASDGLDARLASVEARMNGLEKTSQDATSDEKEVL